MLRTICIFLLFIHYASCTSVKRDVESKKEKRKSKRKKEKSVKKKKSAKEEKAAEIEQAKAIAKCYEYERKFDICLSSDYKPKWIKCAEKFHKIANEGLSLEIEKETTRRKPVKARQVGDNTRVGVMSKKKRQKRQVRGSTLSKKEEKGCRQSERKIHKTCVKSKYDCAAINEAVLERRENVAWLTGNIPGGITPADMSDEWTIEALKTLLMEFKRRAYTLGNMKPRDTILVGDVLNIDEQVVSGHKFEVTLELGITNNPRCKRLSRNGIVGTKVCDDRDNIGIGILSAVHSPWKQPPWLYFEYQDTGGISPSKELYWGEDQDLSVNDEYTEESNFNVGPTSELDDEWILFLDEYGTADDYAFNIDEFDDEWILFLQEYGDEYGFGDLFGTSNYDNVDTNDDEYNIDNNSEWGDFMLGVSPSDNFDTKDDEYNIDNDSQWDDFMLGASPFRNFG